MTKFETRFTEDGSKTFYSQEFQETFHSKYGAKKESEITYIKGCKIPEKLAQKDSLKIIDICYGLGYNSASVLTYHRAINPQCKLEIIALELDHNVPLSAIAQNLLNNWDQEIINILTTLATEKTVIQDNIKLKLIIADARKTLATLKAKKIQADAIFLDPFSPPKCPQLWTVEFLQLVSQCLQPHGIIATYSCSAAVRSAMKLSKLTIGANYGIGRRTPGTVASYHNQNFVPLSPMELEHLQTRAAIPYRDPNLEDSAKTIIERREKEQLLSDKEFTSQWKKRWFKDKNN